MTDHSIILAIIFLFIFLFVVILTSYGLLCFIKFVLKLIISIFDGTKRPKHPKIFEIQTEDELHSVIQKIKAYVISADKQQSICV